jgi:hypothetical protein
MNPSRQLKGRWLFLLISTLICVPTATYYIYGAVMAMQLHRDAQQTREDIAVETRKMTAIKVEVAKELDRLTVALTKPQNYDNEEDFFDFIEGRGEDLAEISGLLKNAEENLDEAEARVDEAFASHNRASIDIAEVALGIARKKLKEAQDALNGYQHAI